MTTNAFTFSQFHAKAPPAGSTYIRIHQLMKYWPELSLYKYGNNPEVLILQKVYVGVDYHFIEHFKGIKILDIADPDWLEGMLIKRTIDAVDAITCPTDALANFIQQMTDKPVVVIPDRYDLEKVPKRPRTHTKPAKNVVWFGYRHNAETLKPAMQLIDALDLNLTVISNDDPLAWQWMPRIRSEPFRNDRYTYVKYDEETVYAELKKADFAVLPRGNRAVDHFKSNNRTTKALLAGLPVAFTADDIREFVSAENRAKYINVHYKDTRQEYDCRKSVEQYKELINTLKGKKLSTVL